MRDTADLGISIDSSSGIPIWLQLRNQLIFKISSGYCGAGYRLPTVRELAVALGINYNTVGKVYQGLERDGYIVSLRGKGTFVVDSIPVDLNDPMSQGEHLADEYVRQCRELGMDREAIMRMVEDALASS